MADEFKSFGRSLTAPGDNAQAIVPSDSADLPNATRAIYVGFTGDVRVTTVGGQTETFPSMAGGMMHSLRVQRVHHTGTTATGLVAVW